MAQNQFHWSDIKVAFMDAHPAIRAQLKKIFEKLQVPNVYEFKDAASAIEFLGSHNASIIIADIYAEEGGTDLLRFVRNRNSAADIPFVVLTGETSEKDIVLASDYGANAYILKPFQADDLIHKIEQVLAEHLKNEGLNYHLRLGEEALIEDKIEDAEVEFKKSIILDNSSSRAYYGMALVKLKRDKIDEAEKMLMENISRNEAFYRNYRVLTDIHLKKGDLATARSFLTKELSYNEKQVDRQLLLGNLYLKDEKPAKAMECYKLVLRENPKDRGALLGMGHAFAIANNFDKAMYYFKRVRRYHAKDLHSINYAVEYGVKANEFKAVETMLRDERKRNNDEVGIFYVLIRWYSDLQNWDEALEMAKEALLIAPEDTNLIQHLGKIYLKRKQLNEACSTFEKLFNMVPKEEILEQYCITLSYCQKFTHIIALIEPRLLKIKRAKLFTLLIESYLRTGASIQAHYLLKKIMQNPEQRTQENLDYWQRTVNSIRTRRNARVSTAS